MEGQNFVVNGGIKMPIGYRFHPTDEELVFHYLKRKALNLPLPASVIPEFDVFQTDPWSLPGDGKEKKYFFSKESYGNYENNNNNNNNNNKCKRVVAGCGYWKPIGKEKPIFACGGTNQVIGTRKALVFRERKRSNETKNRWLLHQFRLVGSAETLHPTWSVFKVIQRKRKAAKKQTATATTNTSAVHMASCCIDFRVEDSSVFGPPPQPSSPSSSEITEVSPNELLDQEENSPPATAAAIGSFSHYCMRKQ